MQKKRDYEVMATIKIIGWNNVSASSEEEAIAIVKQDIENHFDFKVPLLNKYSEISVIIDKGLKDD